MSQEKVLWFLGLEKEQKIDKYVMKFAFWFDFFITAFILICGLLFEIIPITFSNIMWLVTLFLIDVIFLVFLMLIQNPVYIIPYSFIVFLTTIIKLMYGFLIFSNAELIEYGYPQIGWIHMSVLLFAVLTVIFMLTKNYTIWRDLKKYTINEVTAKINKKNKKSRFKWIFVIFGSFPPMFYVRLFENKMIKIGLGMGFGFWLLACCWLLMSCLLIPKFIVSIKYRAFEYFKQ